SAVFAICLSAVIPQAVSASCPKVILKQGDTVNGKVVGRIRNNPALGAARQVLFFQDSTPETLFHFLGQRVGAPRLAAQSLLSRGDSVEGLTVVSMDNAVLNDAANVVVLARLEKLDVTPQVHVKGIVTPTTILARGNTFIDGLRLVFPESPALNNRGNIAFVSTFRRPPGETTPPGCSNDPDGIFTPSSLLFRAERSIGGRLISEVDNVEFADDDILAFKARWAEDLCPDSFDLSDGIFTLSQPL